MDGTRGPAAARAEAFAEKLRPLITVPVHLFDERLSSAEAEDQLAGRGLTHGQKKARRDALAAAAILRNYWLQMSSNP
jgi:putative holliday junction resolvase